MICGSCKKLIDDVDRVSAGLKQCPYCGADILSSSLGKEDTMRDILKHIIVHYSMDILYDSRRINALLKDLAPGYERERKILKSVFDENINVRMLQYTKKSTEEKQAVINKSIRDLIEDAWISDEGARYAVYSLAYALDWTDVMPNEALEQQRNVKGEGRVTAELKKGKHRIDNLDFKYELENYDKIGYKAFSSNKDLYDVIIPESIKVIGNKAFYGCSRLKRVHIPKSVEKIGMLVFEGCRSLTEITADPANDVYGSYQNALIHKKNKHLIRYCNSDSVEYKIPEGITAVYKKAFEGSYFQKLSIPGSLTDFSYHSLQICENLSDICVNSTNQKYTDINGVFHTKDKKTLLIYPMGRKNVWYVIEDYVKVIGTAAFLHAEYLESITIPGSVECIEDRAFAYCVMISAAALPDSVRTIGNYAFYNCIRLSSIMLPRSIEAIGERAFENCSELTRINIPAAVRTIGNSAFRNCSKLMSASIYNGVNFIGDGAFEGCSGNMTVNVIKDSYAEKYLKARNIRLNYI